MNVYWDFKRGQWHTTREDAEFEDTHMPLIMKQARMQMIKEANKQTVQDALNALEEWKTKNPGAPLCVACGAYIDFFGSATTPQEILGAIQKEYRFKELWEAADYILRAELSEYSIH